MNIGYILLAIAVAEAWLGLWFIIRYPKNQTTVWYGLFALSSAVYVGANGFGYVDWFITGQLAEHLAWAGGAMSTIFFLPFSFSFPIARRTYRELLPWVIWPLIIFVPGFLFTNAFVLQHAVVRFGHGYRTAEGPYLWLFLLLLVGYWGVSIYNLASRFTKSGGVHRSQLRILLIGTIISLAVTVYGDVYLPLTSITRIGYIGSLFTVFWLGSATYILLRK